MRFIDLIFGGLQSKPMYQGTARPSERKYRATKKRRQMARESRRKNR